MTNTINNKEELFANVKIDLNNYFNASEEIKHDVALTIELIEFEPKVFPYLNSTMKSNKTVVLEGLKHCGRDLAYVSLDLRTDIEVVLTAGLENAHALEFLQKENPILDNKEVMFKIAAIHGCAIMYASQKLREDEEFVKISTNNDGIALKYAGNRFKKDRSIVLESVKTYGYALEYGKDFKNDREIVLLAVQQVGSALEYASKEHRDDEEIVTLAIQNEGNSIVFASNRLKNNPHIVLKACIQNKEAIIFASPQLLQEIGTENPVEYLTNKILYEQMENNIQNKYSTQNKKKL